MTHFGNGSVATVVVVAVAGAVAVFILREIATESSNDKEYAEVITTINNNTEVSGDGLFVCVMKHLLTYS